MDDEEEAVATAPKEGAKDAALARIPLPVQAIWVVVASLGFIDSLFGSARASFPWHPIASPSALAWLAFAIVGLIVNHLDKIGFPGGANLSFRRLALVHKAAAQSEFSAEALRAVLADYSGLLQNWLQSVNLFTEQLEKYGSGDDDVANILARFCLGRMEEAREVIAERGDRTRLSFWWFVEDQGGLTLLFSDDIRDEATLDHVFEPGVGLLGQCYVEGRTYNLEDAPASIYYERIMPKPNYHGLLLLPVKARTDGAVIGVLSVDREKKEAFDENASNVCTGLADLLAYAMETGLAFEPDDSTKA